jgi:hypothetical protein
MRQSEGSVKWKNEKERNKKRHTCRKKGERILKEKEWSRIID